MDMHLFELALQGNRTVSGLLGTFTLFRTEHLARSHPQTISLSNNCKVCRTLGRLEHDLGEVGKDFRDTQKHIETHDFSRELALCR